MKRTGPRERDPENRRRNIVTPTDEGRAALERFDDAVAAEQEELLASFTPA